MLLEGRGVTPDNRSAESVIRIALYVVRQGLPEDGKHSPARIRSPDSRQFRHPLGRDPQRQQKRRRERPPRVICRFVPLLDVERLPAQPADDASSHADGRTISLDRKRYARKIGHDVCDKRHQWMDRRNRRASSLQCSQFAASQCTAGMKNHPATPFSGRSQTLGAMANLLVGDAKPHNVGLEQVPASARDFRANSLRQLLCLPSGRETRSRYDLINTITSLRKRQRHRASEVSPAHDGDAHLLRTFPNHCPQHNSEAEPRKGHMPCLGPEASTRMTALSQPPLRSLCVPYIVAMAKSVRSRKSSGQSKDPHKGRGKIKTARILSRKLVYKGPVFWITSDRVEEPSGLRVLREVVRHSGSVVVLATQDGPREPLVLLERQYRHAAESYLWELPAGRIDKGEKALAAGKRELLEETGYTARSWKRILHFFASPGFVAETMTVFWARGLKPGRAQPEEDEVIEQHLIPLSKAVNMIQRGTIQDAKTISSVLWLALRPKRKKALNKRFLSDLSP